MEKPKRKQLVKLYLAQQPTRFYLYEAFRGGREDGDRGVDKDGCAVRVYETYQLLPDEPELRLLVRPGTSKSVALQLLDKIRDLIKAEGFKEFKKSD